jgi:hypothetical protein
VVFEGGGGRVASDSRYESRDVIRALEAGALGALLVEYAVEGYRVTTDGRTVERFLPAWSLWVDQDGKVVDRVFGGEAGDFPFPLPGRAVRVGDTWSRPLARTAGQETVRGTATYTLAGLGAGPEGRTARVRFTIDGRATPSSTDGGAVSTYTRGSGKTEGEFEWLLDEGRLGRYSLETAITVDALVTIPGASGLFRATSRAATRGEPLPADRVPTAPATPDYAIAPGRGIGPFALPTTVPDLNQRLGNSDFRELDLGFRAWSRRWSNGLVAYLDPDDNDQVAALEIADRRYRTEQGIGAGSSQGAVVLAYGPAAARVEMTIPGLGTMRILVYNDRGIAFGVASEVGVGGRDAPKSPVGIVAWVTVFAPGSAGKVFAMPGQR